MIGFDKEAIDYIMNAIEEEGTQTDLVLMRKVVEIAMNAEFEYLKSAGIVNGKGEYTEIEYDEDDAFDKMIDAITKALPNKDPFKLSDLLDYYIDFHDQFMSDKGLLEWL